MLNVEVREAAQGFNPCLCLSGTNSSQPRKTNSSRNPENDDLFTLNGVEWYPSEFVAPEYFKKVNRAILKSKGKTLDKVPSKKEIRDKSPIGDKKKGVRNARGNASKEISGSLKQSGSKGFINV